MNIQDATHLFIAGEAMSGGSRNQTEFPESLAWFFGEPQRNTRYLKMRAGGKTRDDRSLAHKVTTLGQDIWRLSLPTRDQGGPVYQDRIILLRRQPSIETIYVVSATDPGSGFHLEWRRQAMDFGTITCTCHLRECGYWCE